MRATRQHAEHRRLRRTLNSKHQPSNPSLDSRSPQFGRSGNRGNSNDSWRDRLDDWRDRISGKAEELADQWRDRWRDSNGNNGNNNGGGPPARSPAPAPPQQAQRPPPTSPGPGNGGGGNGGDNNSPGSGGTNNPSTGGSSSGNSGNNGSNERQSSSTRASAVDRETATSSVPRTSSVPSIPANQGTLITSSGFTSETLLAIPTPTVGAGDNSNASDAPVISPTGGVKKGLSGSIIAVIAVFAILFALLLLVLVLRRRWVARRSERFGQWWTNRKRNSRTYGDYPDEKKDFEWNKDEFVTASVNRPASPLDLSNIVPTAPPVAEVRRLRNGSDAHLVDPSNADRLSIGSSDSFVVHHPTVVSHRTSGTESFKFPKPPSHSDLAAAYSIHSRFGSNGSSSAGASVKAACGHTPLRSQPSSLGSQPPLTPPAPARSKGSGGSADGIPNPFADGDGSESIHNPFADGSFAPLPLTVGNFSQRERIRRPFHPSLKDEVHVLPEDEVKILQIFDDGWAMVEKLEGPSVIPNAQAEKGLIPLACLRDIGQDLSSLLNTKRVQSFHVSNQMTE